LLAVKDDPFFKSTEAKIDVKAPFDVNNFNKFLKTKDLGRSLIYKTETESTMIDVDQLISESARTGSIVLAERQTKGRGRSDRVWASEMKGNLYFSILLRPTLPLDALKINFAIPVAVTLAARADGVNAGIKWPNDVWFQGRKFCGVLVNSQSQGEDFLVNAGVGININEDMTESKDAEVAQVATSLSTALGKPLSREKFLANFCNELEVLLAKPFRDVLFLYESFDILIGKQVVVMPKKREDTTSHYQARAVGLSASGNLRVQKLEKDAPVVDLISEEVTIRFV